jgi:uncharacterized membrane protein
MNTILGVFDDSHAARRAMDELRSSGVTLEDVSIITPAGEGAAGGDDHISAGEGAAVGAVWGGLVGLAALLIPGVGPFIAGGALFAALTGAAAGAIVGGVAGALMTNLGLSEAEARSYETMVHEGRTLVAVKTREEDAQEVRRILASAGATSVRDNQTDLTAGTGGQVQLAEYDSQGRRVERVEQALERGNTGTRGALGASAMTSPNSNAMYGTRGIYDLPEADSLAEAPRMEEDPGATREIPPAGAGRSTETEGWNRTGSLPTPDAPPPPPVSRPDTNLPDPEDLSKRQI